MGIATAFHREAASGDPPEAIWPWPDDRRDCHCFTLRYSADEGCGGTVPPLPPQLLHATPYATSPAAPSFPAWETIAHQPGPKA